MTDHDEQPPTEGDEALRRLAADWHAPPPAPREALWARIDAARRPRPAGGADTTVLPLVPRRPPLRLAWPLAAAALLALGVGLGRWLTPSTPEPTPVATTAPTSGAEAELPVAYRLAVDEHLAKAEALLTLVRASAPTGEVSEYAPETARVLLASNRLLTDSPAGNDPRLRVLLDDLELVLAQIAQLPPSERTEDLDLVTDGIERGGVLARLRTAVLPGDGPLPLTGAL